MKNLPAISIADDPAGPADDDRTTAKTCPHLSKRLQQPSEREFIALIKVTERYKKGRPQLWGSIQLDIENSIEYFIDFSIEF